MEQPYQCTGAKTKFRPKLPPAQITPAYPTVYLGNGHSLVTAMLGKTTKAVRVY